MTRQRNRQVGWLKAFLLTTSVIATLAGAQLLSRQEAVTEEASRESITVVEPAANTSLITLPQSGWGTKLELRPIPQAVVPRLNPVARTRSSL
jgi:hypothetical protein